jgi:hypothetical protein
VNVLTLPLFGPVRAAPAEQQSRRAPIACQCGTIQHQKRFELAAPKCRHNDFASTSNLHVLSKLFSSSMRNGL